MNLRSQQKISKTPNGHNAWRNETMPIVQRQILSRLRGPDPITVQALMGLLPSFDMTVLTSGIITLAENGWVLLEEPSRLVEEIPDVEGEEALPPAPDEALNDLRSRRPVAAVNEGPAPSAEVASQMQMPPETEQARADLADNASEKPRIKVPETKVQDRGTAEQERALLIAMGLIGADAPTVEVGPSFGTASARESEEDPAPARASRVPSTSSSSSVDPRRQAVLDRIGYVTSTRREARHASRDRKATMKSEQEQADAQARIQREIEAAESEAMRRK